MPYEQIATQLAMAVLVALITSGLGALKSQQKPNGYLFGYTFVLSIVSSIAAIQGLEGGVDSTNFLKVLIEMLGVNGIIHAGQKGAAALHAKVAKK